MNSSSLSRLKFAAALVIKASSDPFANPAYKPTPAPRPSIMPKAPNAINDAADKLMNNMMPQVKAVAHHGQHGFNPQMQFKNNQLVGVTQPHFQKPGTPEFSKGVATTAPPPDMQNPLNERYYPADAQSWVNMHMHNPRFLETLNMAPNMDALVKAEDFEGIRSTMQASYEKLKPEVWNKVRGGALANAPDPFVKPTMQGIIDHIGWTADENNSRANILPPSTLTPAEEQVLNAMKSRIGYGPSGKIPDADQQHGLYSWIPRLSAARDNPDLLLRGTSKDPDGSRFKTTQGIMYAEPQVAPDTVRDFTRKMVGRITHPMGPRELTPAELNDAATYFQTLNQTQPMFERLFTGVLQAPASGAAEASRRMLLKNWRDSHTYGLDMNYRVPWYANISAAHRPYMEKKIIPATQATTK